MNKFKVAFLFGLLALAISSLAGCSGGGDGGAGPTLKDGNDKLKDLKPAQRTGGGGAGGAGATAPKGGGGNATGSVTKD